MPICNFMLSLLLLTFDNYFWLPIDVYLRAMLLIVHTFLSGNIYSKQILITLALCTIRCESLTSCIR